MDRTEGLVQRRRQPKVEENNDVVDDDREEEENSSSFGSPSQSILSDSISRAFKTDPFAP